MNDNLQPLESEVSDMAILAAWRTRCQSGGQPVGVRNAPLLVTQTRLVKEALQILERAVEARRRWFGSPRPRADEVTEQLARATEWLRDAISQPSKNCTPVPHWQRRAIAEGWLSPDSANLLRRRIGELEARVRELGAQHDPYWTEGEEENEPNAESPFGTDASLDQARGAEGE